jgi:hypothetical protein
MSVTVVATPGASDANSYVTIAEAAAYFAARLGGSAWDDLAVDGDDQARALITATRRLDLESFPGTRAVHAQALAWPRYGVLVDGALLSGTTIPVLVKAMCCEEALSLLQDPEKSAETGLEGFASLDLGPLSLVNRPAGVAGGLAAPTRRLLARLGGRASDNSFTVIRS